MDCVTVKCENNGTRLELATVKVDEQIHVEELNYEVVMFFQEDFKIQESR